MIYFLLGFIVFIYIIRKSNTADLIKQANIETDEQEDIFDDAVLNIKSTKLSCIFLATSLISLIVIVLIRYTTIELFFMNYFGSEWFREDITISLAYYGIPFFILIIRGIIVQVNIGDYVKKNFNLHEEEVNIKDEAKKLLFKPKKKTATPEAPASGETLELTTGFVSATTAPTPVATTPAPAPQPVAAVQPVAPVASVAEQTTQQQQ